MSPESAGEVHGVVVLGMHRSGTSAVTRLLNLCGASLPSRTKLSTEGRANPTGFWEVPALSAFNEKLLWALDGDWSAPPDMPPGWHRDARLEAIGRRARRAFLSRMPRQGWLWKDPRLCLTLPFWMDVLTERPAVVLVLRNPLEISKSLAQRNGFPHRLSLALWEIYLREALVASTGLPVKVVRYEAVIGEPVQWCRSTRDWLEGLAVRCNPMAPEGEIASFIDVGLQHAHYSWNDVLEDATVSASQRALIDASLASESQHDRFQPPPLPDLTTWVNPLIAERRVARREQRRRKRLGRTPMARSLRGVLSRVNGRA